MAAIFNSGAFMQIFERHILDHLDIEDFLHLELVGTFAGSVVATGDHWKTSVARCWPNITFGDALFERACRRVFVSCLASLSGASQSTRCFVEVKDENDARKLTKLMRNARTSADAHLRNGGSSAEVILCQLHKGGNLPEAKDSAMELGHLEFERKSAGAKPEVCSLDLQLEGQRLLICAQSLGSKPAHTQGLTGDGLVSLDLTSANPALLLHLRSFEVPSDGNWTHSKSGLCSFSRGRAAATEQISRGVTCVLCIRTGGPRTKQTSMAHGLHLDLVRPRAE
jgi:hypothetical protein